MMPAATSRNRWVFLLILGAATACQQDSSPRTTGSSDSVDTQIVGQVGSSPITLEEVDEVAIAAGIRPFQALYEIRKTALDSVIADRLFEQAAASRGTTKEELFETEVIRKAQPVTESDVSTFYQQNRSRMGSRPLAEIEGQIRQILEGQKTFEARERFIEQLKKEIAVISSLQPPRAPVKVAANDPSWGPADAKVTIIEFSDFQ